MDSFCIFVALGHRPLVRVCAIKERERENMKNRKRETSTEKEVKARETSNFYSGYTIEERIVYAYRIVDAIYQRYNGIFKRRYPMIIIL